MSNEHVRPSLKDRAQLVLAKNSWFDPKSFESEKLYERLGVLTFKKYTPLTGDWTVRHIGRLSYAKEFKLTEESLDYQEQLTRNTEMIHYVETVVVTGALLQMMKGEKNKLKEAGVIFGVNTIANFLPIFAQRYNRIRIQRARNTMRRMNERQRKREDRINNIDKDPA